MLTPWANHIALLAFGLTIGVLVRVMMLLLPASWEEAGHRRRRLGEGHFEAARSRAEEQNAIMAAEIAKSPALRLLTRVVPTLIAVLIATIVLSPVELEWTWLLGSLLAGGVLAELAARLTRAGRLGVHWTRGARPIRLLWGDGSAGTTDAEARSRPETGS